MAAASDRAAGGATGPSRWRLLPLGSSWCRPRHGRGRLRDADAPPLSLSLETLVAYRERLQAFVAAHYGPLALLAYMAVYVTAVDALDSRRRVPDHSRRLPVRLARRRRGRGGRRRRSARSCVFLIARTSIGDILIRKARARGCSAWRTGSGEDAFSYLLFLRFLPIDAVLAHQPRLALCSACRCKTFALATMIGIMPATFAFAVAGAGLDSVIAAQQPRPRGVPGRRRDDCAFEFDIEAPPDAARSSPPSWRSGSWRSSRSLGISASLIARRQR